MLPPCKSRLRSNIGSQLETFERYKWRDLVSVIRLSHTLDKELLKTTPARSKSDGTIAKDSDRSEMEALFREELKHEQAMFAKEKYAGRVGAFEGAIYEARGYYRPEVDCIMFSRTNHFCAVCRRAIERVIRMYARG